MEICPSCKESFSSLEALSRYGDYMVCSKCGNKEALQIAFESGRITKECLESQYKMLDSLYESLEK